MSIGDSADSADLNTAEKVNAADIDAVPRGPVRGGTSRTPGWFGKPLTEKDERVHALREHGYRGPIDADGYAAKEPTADVIDDAIRKGKQDAEQARAARATPRSQRSTWAIGGGKGAIPKPTGPVREGPSRTKVAARGAGKRVSAATRAGIWHWTTKKRTTTRTVWRFLLFGTTGRPSGLQLSHAQRVAIGRKSIKKRRRRSNGRLI
jgi:hypothetical protein